MIIYSDDPRGVEAAIAEETAKGNKVRLRSARFRPVKAPTIEEDTGPLDVYDMTKAELQGPLRDNGVPFEGDANKSRLIELAQNI